MTWKNFTREEFACSCGCGTNEILDKTIDFAQSLRAELGFPLAVTSGYRCKGHPSEKKKSKPGSHNRGMAVDFGVSGGKAKLLARAILSRSLGGVGINQKGPQNARFIHGDIDANRLDRFWTY